MSNEGAILQAPRAAGIAPAKGARPARLLQLDVLRGIAIILVLFRHAAVTPLMAKSWANIANRIYMIGWTGVDLFFVLSGFLIGGLLFHEIRSTGRLDVKRFLIRRGFKIWPSYFLLIVVIFALDLMREHMSVYEAIFTGVASKRLMPLWPNLVHLQNYFDCPRGHMWSLSVEEHFYLALPLVLVLLLRRAPGKAKAALSLIPWVALTLGVVCLALRVLVSPHLRSTWGNQYAGTHIRIDGLFFGVFLAYLHHFHPQQLARVARRRGLLLLIGLALLVPFVFYDQYTQFSWTYGFTMLYLAYGAIIVAAVYSESGKDWLGTLLSSWPARVLAFVGVFSYSIYLWQVDLAIDPFDRWVIPNLPHMSGRIYYPLVQGSFIIWATIAGAIMAKLVEAPSLALRERLFPSRVPSAVPGPVAPLAESTHASSTPVGAES